MTETTVTIGDGGVKLRTLGQGEWFTCSDKLEMANGMGDDQMIAITSTGVEPNSLSRKIAVVKPANFTGKVLELNMECLVTPIKSVDIKIEI